MAKTLSTMLPLGTEASQFLLTDVISNQQIGLTQKQPTVVFFICNHCPYVKHINKELVNVANEYLLKKVVFLGINSNDVTHYPDDSPENMKKVALEEGYPFPYLYDETQEVAKAFQAACTPDFYIFDSTLHLVYRGQFDDSRPGNSIKPTGKSIRHTLDCLLNNQPVDIEQKPSLGCNIKWI